MPPGGRNGNGQLEQIALTLGPNSQRGFGRAGLNRLGENAPPRINHPGARRATPPESGGELFKNSPPQMRRGGAPSAGVVLTSKRSADLFFRSAAHPRWTRKSRGPKKQVRATLPRPEFLPILGSRKAVNAQNDSPTSFSAACLAPSLYSLPDCS